MNRALAVISSASLKQRLMALVFSLLLLGGAVGIFGMLSLRASTQALFELEKMTSGSQWFTLSTMKGEELMAEVRALDSGYKTGNPSGADALEAAHERLARLDQIETKLSSDSEVRLKQAKNLGKFTASFQKMKSKVSRFLDLLKDGRARPEDLKPLVAEASAAKAEMDEAVVQSLLFVSSASGGKSKEATQRENAAMLIFGAAAFLGLLGAFGAISFVLRLAADLGEMSSRLRGLASAVGGATVSMDETGRDLLLRVNRQLSSLHESSASLEEFSAQIVSSARGAESTLGFATEAQAKAEGGLLVIEELSKAMNQIGEANFELRAISEIMEEVGRKTQVIHDIVFKTQLLSLNASIEAARAGQHGRGFAVVAEEVGALAEGSSGAAIDIRRLLDASSQRVTSMLESVERRVTAAQASSSKCVEAFSGISSSISMLAPMVEAIKTASREQEQGVTQTKQAFSEINIAARENADAAHRVSRLAPSLRKESEEMRHYVQKLDRLVFGKSP